MRTIREIKLIKAILSIVLVFTILFTGCKKGADWEVEDPTKDKSFFGEHVKYPFPVKYVMGKDSKGVNWKIGVMDVSPENVKNPPVLVLIHGKGANAGYFGHIISKAVKAGIRVIAPDIPFYGKSLPPNLDKNISRTLQHTREAIYDVIVNKLGVKKAVYLGHSLGGQWALGYALTYPDAVSKIILEAPGGLETFQMPLFDPTIIDNIEMWKQHPVYNKLLKQELKKTPEQIKLFYYYKKKKGDKIVDAYKGYFLKDTEYTKFLTQVRVKMIKGNQKEYKAYCVTYIRDIYTLGVEMYPKNPQFIYDKYPQIKCPILLTFGEKEPFIPSKLSGKYKQGLKKGIVLPFYKMMKQGGNAPVVKFYNNAAHFIHTDLPDKYAADVIQFTKKTTVQGAETEKQIMDYENIEDKK